MHIRTVIQEFIHFVLEIENDDATNDLGLLIDKLDLLAFSIGKISFTFDENDYPDSPGKNYHELLPKIKKRFPSIGFYNVVENISDELGSKKILMQDAADDLADIVADLEDVLWRFNNTSDNDALWYCQFSFKSHWGLHLRNLQLYLHDKYW